MLELQTPFTTTHTASQRLGRIALKLSRKKQTISILVGLNFLKVQPQDWIYVTNERFGFDQKTFQVMSVELSPIGDSESPTLAVRITAREIDNTVTPFLTADYTTPEATADDLTLSHSEFIGNQSIIDDNISLFGSASASSVTTASGSTALLTQIASTTVNFTGFSSGNVMINVFFLPFINDTGNGGTRKKSCQVQILRGSTTIFDETFRFLHINAGGTDPPGVIVANGFSAINTIHVDTNVGAGSYTYSVKVLGIFRAESVRLAVSVFTK